MKGFCMVACANLGKFPEKQAIVETTQLKILARKSYESKISSENFLKKLSMQGWVVLFSVNSRKCRSIYLWKILKIQTTFITIVSLFHARHLVCWEAVQIQ